jgi:dipeptidyl aminopeptidase/acylaminoacyl peptidase
VQSPDALDPLTDDPRFIHHVAGISSDGRLLAYTSNRANGVDFDLWTCELATRVHRLLYAAGTWLVPGSGISPDGRYVSLLSEGTLALDSDLHLVELATGTATRILPHPGVSAQLGAPAWLTSDRFAFAANVDSDMIAIHTHDLRDGTTQPLSTSDPRLDAEVVTSRDGTRLLVIENDGGRSTMRLLDGAGGQGAVATDDAPRGAMPAPIATEEPGVVSSYSIDAPRFSADAGRLYYTLSGPRIPGDVFAYEVLSGITRRLTTSPTGVAQEQLVVPETIAVESFDGERVPAFVYRPPTGAARPPVVVLVHGGPEAQSMLTFNAVVQGLALAGYGVVVPNVRGSTGYGKRYAALDDIVRRLDSVRDLAAVHGALAGLGFDPDRAVLWGASYGGYMVLAGLAFQPELWAAGVDIVGISDLVTFLENTSAYRRVYREREYGSLAHDREFLASASPLRRAEAIRAPLFVIHGRNDPRVPVSEAEQLVAKVRRQGVRSELVIYEDEGHGLARLANRLDAYPRAVAFLDEVLG